MKALFAIFIVSIAGLYPTTSVSGQSSQVDSVYIPTDLLDAVSQLDHLLSPDQIERIDRFPTADSFLVAEHWGIGLWIRNNWGLWAGDRLAKYFMDNEVYHPESMSGIILISYYRSRKNVPLEIEHLLEETSARDVELRASEERERTAYFDRTLARYEQEWRTHEDSTGVRVLGLQSYYPTPTGVEAPVIPVYVEVDLDCSTDDNKAIPIGVLLSDDRLYEWSLHPRLVNSALNIVLQLDYSLIPGVEPNYCWLNVPIVFQGVGN